MSDDPVERCEAPEQRQFDFWVGEWEVAGPKGKVAGHNSITLLFDGCALREEWSGAGGHRGTSLNAWVAERSVWHQTWVDSTGGVLLLEGGLRDGAMVMEGSAPKPDTGGVVRHRISWSATDADHLRQHWQTSDDGEEWQTVFDGRYSRMR
jgi:hypothetical protein